MSSEQLGTLIVVGSVSLLGLIWFFITAVQQWRAEDNWILQNGAIPDGHCLVYKRQWGKSFCVLQEVMPSQKGKS